MRARRDNPRGAGETGAALLKLYLSVAGELTRVCGRGRLSASAGTTPDHPDKCADPNECPLQRPHPDPPGFAAAQRSVRIPHRFGHALHVSLLRLHQTEQILLRRRGHIMIARAEAWIERVREFSIPTAEVIERPFIANPIFLRQFSVNLHFILFAISKADAFKCNSRVPISYDFHTFKCE